VERPFFRGQPGRLLLVSTLVLVMVTFAIPFLPFAFARRLRPALAAAAHDDAVVTLAYVAATELAKGWFYRAHPDPVTKRPSGNSPRQCPGRAVKTSRARTAVHISDLRSLRVICALLIRRPGQRFRDVSRGSRARIFATASSILASIQSWLSMAPSKPPSAQPRQAS
jgi:hypothetical protein